MKNMLFYNAKKIMAMLKDPSSRNRAFSIIVEQHSEKIYWHIRNMVLSHEDTNDLVQETFIKAWNSIDSFRGESQIATWLYRIAINEVLSFLRKKHIETVSLDNEEHDIANSIESDVYFSGNRADALFREAVSSLPEKQRLVFNMKYFEEMKYEDISKILDTSIGALKASYHIAVKKIENYINEED